MIAVAPKENEEKRVAVTPIVVPALIKAGLEVRVESGAGLAAGFPDADYESRGAHLEPSRDALFAAADLVLCVRGPRLASAAGRADLERLRPGQKLVGFLDPLGRPRDVLALASRGVEAMAMELMPRISRAQSMDALSSMATVAGYRAVLLAATALPRMFPMMITAAGTISPARVLIVGAGVAGLQAIATARRLGAVVRAYDVRAAAGEEVRSLGAKFLEVPLAAEETADKEGYAKALGEDVYRRQRELLSRAVAESDVVITTAAVPGRRSPVLVDAESVRRMVPGSVIVDLAAERGGNCELTEPGATVVRDGVTIMGPFDLAAEIPHDASLMYARNVSAFVRHLMTAKPDGAGDDEIAAATLVTRGGAVVNARVRDLAAEARPEPGEEAAPAGGAATAEES